MCWIKNGSFIAERFPFTSLSSHFLCNYSVLSWIKKIHFSISEIFIFFLLLFIILWHIDWKTYYGLLTSLTGISHLDRENPVYSCWWCSRSLLRIWHLLLSGSCSLFLCAQECKLKGHFHLLFSALRFVQNDSSCLKFYRSQGY